MKKFLLVFFVLLFVFSAFAQEKYTIQQYLSIRSAGSPALSPDGKRLFYLTNVTGTSQIWMIDLPSGAPKQITNYDDNVGFVRFSPKGDGAVFGKARGGDENTQFFWIKSDGTGIKELTNSPKIRHNFGDWSADGTKIYYASNKRNPQFFDIYAMNVADGKEELLYQYDGSNSFAAASDDGSKIIVSRSGTELSLDNNLFLIDVKTKAETLLTPHEGSAEFENVNFITNDEIEFTTNDKREFMSLSRMPLEAKQMRVLSDSEWDIDSIRISRKNKIKAQVVNREGFSELDIYKPKKMGKDRVNLPAQGIVGGLNFSEDGSLLAFSFVSSKYNSDIWLYDTDKKSLAQITKSERSGIAQESFVEPQLIKYKLLTGAKFRLGIICRTDLFQCLPPSAQMER